MKISIIVAVAENLGIGKDNKLMWHLPSDLKFFKSTTMNHHIIMGRKTYESIGKALPGRTSIIVTNNKNFKAEGCVIVYSLREAIEKAKTNNETEAFVIGGAGLINESLDIADKIYLTEVKENFDADVFLKPIDKNKWREVKRIDFTADEKHKYDYSFVELARKN